MVDLTTPANIIIISKISVLEMKITPRRLRDAILGVDAGWLSNLENQIAALRSQIK